MEISCSWSDPQTDYGQFTEVAVPYGNNATVRKQRKVSISKAEFLSGFRKEDINI